MHEKSSCIFLSEILNLVVQQMESGGKNSIFAEILALRMTERFIFILALVAINILLIICARKIRVAYPILLVLAGLALSFIPGLPMVVIDPELIFLIFLPPLLYEAAWNISWKSLWKFRRTVMSFAFPLVMITATCVALVSNYFIPGFSIALGFLLGGIISPPDAVSAGAILKFVRVPKILSTILEGESLLNDASSLIIFRFALIAIGTGQFVWYEALGSFVWMVIGGTGIGLLIAYIFIRSAKRLNTDATIDTILTLIAPFIMYLAAEEAHASGVLSVVAGGLLMSNKRHLYMESSSRLSSINVWESLTFVLNGLVFMLIGLNLPQIISGLGETSISTAIGYALIVTAAIIILRIIAAYSAIVITLIMRNFITVAVDFRDSETNNVKRMWHAPIITGWAGMRGVVSLAAALSIPVYLKDGQPFPHRDLILFITFVVILVTLVLQGITLPWIIRKVNLPEDFIGDSEKEQRELAKELQQFTVDYIRNNFGPALTEHPQLFEFVKKMESHFQNLDPQTNKPFLGVYKELIKAQRKHLMARNQKEEDLDEEAVRYHLHRLDVEEERLHFLE